MAATDMLHPEQFDGYDKHAEEDKKGADERAEFGYDEFDYKDNQYNRRKHTGKLEVF